MENKIPNLYKESRMTHLIRNRYFLIIILAAFVAISIMIVPSQMDLDKAGNGWDALVFLLSSELDAIEFSDAFAITCIIVLFHKLFFRSEYEFLPSAFTVSGILSCLLICGMSLSSFHDLSFILGRKVQFAIAAASFIGFWSVIYAVVKMIYLLLDHRITSAEVKFKKLNQLRLPGIIDRYPVISFAVIMLIMWGGMS